MSWRWTTDRKTSVALLDRTFPSQGEAESWLGEFYLELLAAGVRAVSLHDGDRLVYGPMSLEADG